MSRYHSLTDLPPEIIHNILIFLDVPSLLQTSRTSHLLRTLSLDPLLHKTRFHQARCDLYFLLVQRLPKSSISPPNAWIWLSKTNVLSRSISKSLIRIRLSHSLERRPCVDDLVNRAILPECCSQRKRTSTVSPAIVVCQEAIRKSRLKDRLGRFLERRPSIDRVVALNIIPPECATKEGAFIVSPKLVETRRKIIRERLKDSLRAWVKRTAVQEQKRKEEEYDDLDEAGTSVKAIVKRFAARREAVELEEKMDKMSVQKKLARQKWGREVEVARCKEERKVVVWGACSQPNRAHVLGLRRFWESVTKSAG